MDNASIMPSAKSALLYERALKVLPGGNTRTTVFFKPHPLYAQKGDGCRITDVDGTVRIDAINNFTSLIHGYNHPAINAAVTEQLASGMCFGLPTEAEIDLAELLCDRVESVEQVRFMNSGTEAVMTAIKAARAYTGRPMIAKCEGSYHGTYDFAEISEGASPDRWGERIRPQSVASSLGTPQGVLSDVLVLPFNDVEVCEKLLLEHAERLACILIDPMPNRVGLIKASPDYLAMLRRVADKIGSLLVFDEIIAFRLGYNGAQGAGSVKPDLTTFGKIIGGGFPVGALGGNADIMAVFDPRRGKPSVPHGGTFTANPMTMVAGQIALRLLTPESFDYLHRLGEQLQNGIEKIFKTQGIDGQVTGAGSLRRIHFGSARLHDYRSSYADGAKQQRMTALHQAMLRNGILMAPTGLMALSTPMTGDDIGEIIDAFGKSLSSVAAS
ncbi:aspartate aminotransferase family protein [Dongia soli]|uniref:Aspartate aminotransferase family protein n=1 Tax=Dongia soli TaxID=600628 RepID=A0ABU5EBQ9_9PROT|nr:aspartate aminotransferase family protein [Dongia soli]MDY0883628.1 aspartate aminotransferase family protein [Dongia soli]